MSRRPKSPLWALARRESARSPAPLSAGTPGRSKTLGRHVEIVDQQFADVVHRIAGRQTQFRADEGDSGIGGHRARGQQAAAVGIDAARHVERQHGGIRCIDAVDGHLVGRAHLAPDPGAEQGVHHGIPRGDPGVWRLLDGADAGLGETAGLGRIALELGGIPDRTSCTPMPASLAQPATT